MNVLLHRFFDDTRVQIALLLIILDLGLGIVAAFKKGNFRLSYIADTLKADVLWRIFPFFLLYGGYVFAKNADIVIPGLDMEVLMNGAWALVLLAMTGSILSSIKDLGLLGSENLPDEVAGPEPKPQPAPNPQR